ncbi:MAG TPA: TSUP family transporter [Peptococcaceae bacterium]|nr:TSUP family transporter [Peptococcaceae bacterium]
MANVIDLDVVEWKVIVFVCFFVFLAGLIDSIAGGGGLISLPAYIASGLPVHMALGCNKFSSALGTVISSLRFWRNKKVHLKTVVISIICALIGSAAGARVVLFVDDYIFRIILLVIIPVVAAFVFLKKDFGTINQVKSLSQKRLVIVSALIGLGIGFYDGFLGPGTGTFLIFSYALLLRFDLITASGNAKLVNLASNLGALIMFLIHGQVYFALAVPATFFGIVGNFIGSGLALRKGSKVIRPVFLIALALLVISLILSLINKA